MPTTYVSHLTSSTPSLQSSLANIQQHWNLLYLWFFLFLFFWNPGFTCTASWSGFLWPLMPLRDFTGILWFHILPALIRPLKKVGLSMTTFLCTFYDSKPESCGCHYQMLLLPLEVSWNPWIPLSAAFFTLLHFGAEALVNERPRLSFTDRDLTGWDLLQCQIGCLNDTNSISFRPSLGWRTVSWDTFLFKVYIFCFFQPLLNLFM